PTRRSSDLRSVDAARSPAEPSAAPSPALSRPTTAPRRQNATATDAGPLSAAAPSPPPSAPRSCARRASAAQRNNHAVAWPDRHARSHSQALRHKPKTDLHCSLIQDPSQPSLAKNESSKNTAEASPQHCGLLTQ